tara:strand:- start:300 stop:515 length:216 start_codon:yes stop_codon:yes gene_type:complete
MEKWIGNWKKKGWKTESGKPVLNQDLWKELNAVRIDGGKFEYIKGPIAPDRDDKIALKYYNKELLPLSIHD